MSIVERLFPASELEALRASPYDFDLEPSSKRRKLSSTSSVILPEIYRTSTNDSGYSSAGYSSDEDCPVPEAWKASRKRSRSSLSTASSAGSPTPPPSSYTQSALFRKYLSTTYPMHSANCRLPTQSDLSHLTPDDLKDYYHQITLARSRSRSGISGLPTPPYSNGSIAHYSSSSVVEDHEADDEAESCVPDVGQGWTAGPKSAMAANLSARIFDGVRITSHERTMLNSLIPGSLPEPVLPAPTTQRNSPPMPAPVYAERRGTQTDVPAPASSSFAGIAISAYTDDDEDEIANNDIEHFQLEGAYSGKVEDFFNIEEASENTTPAVVYAGLPTSWPRNYPVYGL